MIHWHYEGCAFKLGLNITYLRPFHSIGFTWPLDPAESKRVADMLTQARKNVQPIVERERALAAPIAGVQVSPSTQCSLHGVVFGPEKPSCPKCDQAAAVLPSAATREAVKISREELAYMNRRATAGVRNVWRALINKVTKEARDG